MGSCGVDVDIAHLFCPRLVAPVALIISVGICCCGGNANGAASADVAAAAGCVLSASATPRRTSRFYRFSGDVGGAWPDSWHDVDIGPFHVLARWALGTGGELAAVSAITIAETSPVHVVRPTVPRLVPRRMNCAGVGWGA